MDHFIFWVYFLSLFLGAAVLSFYFTGLRKFRLAPVYNGFLTFYLSVFFLVVALAARFYLRVNISPVLGQFEFINAFLRLSYASLIFTFPNFVWSTGILGRFRWIRRPLLGLAVSIGVFRAFGFLVFNNPDSHLFFERVFYDIQSILVIVIIGGGMAALVVFRNHLQPPELRTGIERLLIVMGIFFPFILMDMAFGAVVQYEGSFLFSLHQTLNEFVFLPLFFLIFNLGFLATIWGGVSQPGPNPQELRAQLKQRYGLSDREIDIFWLVQKGYSNTEISEDLVISLSTVKTHLNHIFKKVGVSSRAKLIAAAQQ